MAPKKKKKPAANPARGFATTSLPSKSRAGAAPEESVATDDETSQVAVGGGFHPTAVPDKKAALKTGEHSAQGLQIEHMTPEELEAHLESSELDSFLDKYATRAIGDARRQVLRLETERRQLRQQTQKLSTYSWLPVETVTELFDMSAQGDGTLLLAQGNHSTIDEEKMSFDLWTLERVLQSLNLPKISEAIAHVIQLALLGKLTFVVDSLLGLPEALQWYASNTQSDEILNYEQTASDMEQRGGATPSQSTSEPTNTPPSRQSPVSTPAMISEAEIDSTPDLSSSDSEEDDDPSKLTERYVRISRQLWDVQNGDPGSDAKAASRKGRRVNKLNQKLQQIRRDPLFDEREADDEWSVNFLELQAVQQHHLRAAVGQRRKKKRNITQDTSDALVEAVDSASNTGQADEGDADGMLGSMFGDSEDAQPLPSEAVNESSVRLLDLGKWSGLPPKRLLEEMCKSRDSRCRIQVKPLKQTSYSAKHKIQILWNVDTMPEAQAAAALTSEVSIAVTERSWDLGMVDVAATSAVQSEAYICTLALFLMSSLGPSELKAVCRLPTVWRGLLKDLTETKQSIVNEEHKADIRRLRALIHEKQEQSKQFPNQTLNGRVQATINTNNRRRARPPPAGKLSPEQVSRKWHSRTSRPAFQEMVRIREELPVHQYKDMILSCIGENPVSIICAETGAGKSSGIPVQLLERQFSEGRDCRILVTQPRRISAITLARRVSQELGESRNDVGTSRSLVGYAIRLESKTSNSTRITYATTGVLLRMLEESPDLNELDYLILDEVHERGMDLDLLFIALQKLQKRRDTLKIILMSATVDAKKFSDYFGGAPVLDLPGRTFPCEFGFLEDAVEASKDLGSIKEQTLIFQDDKEEMDDFNTYEKAKPIIAEPEKYSSQTQRMIASIDEYRIDYNLIARLAVCIATKPQYAKYSSAVLIFMPGIGEMRRLHSLLLSLPTFSRNWIVHLLHSTFSTEELERAFERPPPGHRKIVIATNIAETGITIPDVTAVIDTCKEKIMRFDERRQLSRLTEGFISRSSARQRRGRAARVQDGLCFHLVTKHRYDNSMLEQQVPEMLRLSLQDPMLRIKVWDLGSIEETLSAAIDPPSRKNVLRAIEKLKDAGALSKNEALTPLGQQIARLPLEVSLAKLAIFGVIFKCLDSVLTVIALVTSKSPFLPIPASQGSPVDARHIFKRGDSDLLSSLNAYESWKKAKANRVAPDFCRKNHINDQTMGQVEEQKIQLLVYLADAGLVNLDSEERIALNRARTYHGQRVDIYSIPIRYSQPLPDRALNGIIAISLYPRILMREGKGWRNPYTNQVVSLTSRSINHHFHSPKPPRWLSFYEAMQNTRSGTLNVFETTTVPESVLALLLGSDAEFKFYAGVLVLDGGKVKLSVRQCRELMAIKILRERVDKVLMKCYAAPGREVAVEDRRWLDFWLKIEAAQES